MTDPPHEFVIVVWHALPHDGVGHTHELPLQDSPFVQLPQNVGLPHESFAVPH